MKSYANNPRVITDKQKKKLEKSMKMLGDISGIVHDVGTDEVICGNQRMKAIGFTDEDIRITERYEEPLADKTVAIGYIERDGVRLNYRAVRFSDYERALASLSANKLGGEFDEELFDGFSDSVLEKCGFEKLEKYENAVKRQIVRDSRKSVIVGVFSIHVPIDDFDMYCEYLQSKDEEKELIELFLEEIGL